METQFSLTAIRARQATVRPFPHPAPLEGALDTPALSIWLHECWRGARGSRWWSRTGFKWRRAEQRAYREFTRRLIDDADPSPSCQQCRVADATTHVAYSPHDAPTYTKMTTNADSVGRSMQQPARPPRYVDPSKIDSVSCSRSQRFAVPSSNACCRGRFGAPCNAFAGAHSLTASY